MTNHNSKLVVEGVSAGKTSIVHLTYDPGHLARSFGTPLLVIDEHKLRETVARFRRSFSSGSWRCQVTYAAKALLLKAIAKLMYDEGLALDVCSEGELQTVQQAGVPLDRCTLHGCAKTYVELDSAVRLSVGYVVVDNEGEIRSLDRITQTAGKRARVLVRINVGLTAPTKTQVQTSALESKFGFPTSDGQALAAVKAVAHSTALDFAGIHCHIGSQIHDLASYSREIERLADFARYVMLECGIPCGVINVGGGLGISDSSDEDSAPTPEAWARTIFESLERVAGDLSPRSEIIVEPGRAIIARAGTTLYTIAVRKTLGNGAQALIVDGGMSDNPRPALYEAKYPVALVSDAIVPPDGRYAIFGRHCETDLLFPDVPLANPQPGDVLAVHNTGAYTYSMASNYNRFPRLAVVLVDGDNARLIARREPLDHLLDLDV